MNVNINWRTMKKFWMIVLLCIGMISTSLYAQKKNGIVYSEHESIELTRELWEKFKAGDAEGFLSFMADTAKVFVNGKDIKTNREETISYVNFYKNNIVDLEIRDHTPAYPDAIEYKKSGTWVQDWLLLTGVHKETGIKLKLHIHHLYQFNKDGKIATMLYYMDTDVFDEIRNSKRTIENGTIYINHPYIVTVRKAVNAFEKKDLETWKSFYDEKVKFGNSAMKWGEMRDLETQINIWKESRFMKPDNNFKIEQVGYPDCMYYAKNDGYVVYSWWLYKEKGKDGILEVPYMLSCTFNKEGKIIREFVWYSSNHFDKK